MTIKNRKPWITEEEFRAAEVVRGNCSTYLGAWNTKEFFFVVFTYPNGARLRITYWKPAEQVLACVRDYYGAYHCIGNNIKSLEEVNRMVLDFDWRMYDAEQAKKAIHGTTKADAKPTQEDMQDILEHLNKIQHDNSDRL